MCSSVVDGLSLNGAVDGGAGDAEQFGELGRRVRARAMDFHQVTLLGHRQLGLFAPEMAFRFGYLHPFACSGSDEVGFELCHHREDVEQQSPE